MKQFVEEFRKVFAEALADPANRDEDGQIDWNFVDADCYMALRPDTKELRAEYYGVFNDLADEAELAEAKLLMGAK